MKKFIQVCLIAGFVIFLILAVWRYIALYHQPWTHTISVKDITQPEAISLKSQKEGVYGIHILIRGYINGNAKIHQSYIDKPMYTYDIKSGKVAIPIGGDWYSNTCILRYEPIDVKDGYLEISYKFEFFE